MQSKLLVLEWKICLFLTIFKQTKIFVFFLLLAWIYNKFYILCPASDHALCATTEIASTLQNSLVQILCTIEILYFFNQRILLLKSY